MLNLANVKSESSYSPIKPGEEVKVKLKKVEITPEGDLDFYFEGTEPSNAGQFKPRFWASNLDPTSDRYQAEKAEQDLEKIKQILEAYLDNNTVAKVQGRNAAEFFNSIVRHLTPDVINIETVIKIVYKYNSDKDCVFPKYGSFISTSFRPRGLKLRDKADKNGIPYERVLPLAEYGAVPDAGNNADDLPFGGEEEEEEIPFGNN